MVAEVANTMLACRRACFSILDLLWYLVWNLWGFRMPNCVGLGFVVEPKC